MWAAEIELTGSKSVYRCGASCCYDAGTGF